VKVTVELPAPVIEAGLKVAVTPLGRPLAATAMAELNPPVTVVVNVAVPFAPLATVTVAGEALTAKAGAAVTVSAIVAVWVVDPLLAFTLMFDVAAAAFDPALRVKVSV
jgi:hypothetical protein